MEKDNKLEGLDKKVTKVNSSKVSAVLNIIDAIIEGKRFGEFNSKKQIYLLSCQAKLTDMQQGIYTEADITFLTKMIDTLIQMFQDAKSEVEETLKYFNNQEN